MFDVFSHAPVGQLTVEPVFGWYAALPLIVIMAASLWLTLTSTGVSARGRLVLAGLRLAAMLVLLLGWLRPGMVASIERESEGAIAVVMDRSESMTLPGGASGESRWAVQKRVWEAINAATGLKIGETKIVPFFYDRQAVAPDGDDLPALENSFAKSPAGRLTDIGKALTDVAGLQVEPPLRGVILMGDATQTLLPASVDATVVARQMAQLDQPILMVGIGQQSQNQLRDVAIEGMPETLSAFAKKEVRVPMVISTLGMQSTEIKVSLTLRASGKQDHVVDLRKVIPSSFREKLAVEFTFVVPDVGEYLLEAQAAPPRDFREQIVTNNTVSSFITVRDGGVRILYLEGQPRSELSFLKRSIDESLDFELDFEYIPEKDRNRNRWHAFTRNLDFNPYDAVIIGDLDASALSTAVQDKLKRHIENGAGLLLMGGFHSFGAGGYERSQLKGLIPFQMGTGKQAWGRPDDDRFHINRDIKLRLPQGDRGHAITKLAHDPTENQRLWESLKPLLGMNRFGKPSTNPGVRTLLASADGEPALMTNEAGRGRVLAFAGDTTWRWWTSGNKKLHQQFWRQCLLWLVKRDSLTEGFRMDLDRRRLSLGETPELAIAWVGGTDSVPMPDEVKIELSRDGRWLQNIGSAKTSEGSRKAEISGLDEAGLYRAKLTATASDGKTHETDIAFLVKDESLELAYPSADRQLMDNIVSANRIAGGQRILPEEIDQAIDWLRKRQDATKVTTVEKRRLGDAAWDAWLYLVIFCALMSTEWGLRKSWQLP